MAVEVPQGWVPTFALKPKDNERFLPKQAKQVVEELVEKSCKGLTYAADKCQAMAMQLAEQIRDALHKLPAPRYKIVVQSVIGEVRGQGVRVSSRCLWDSETDSSVSFNWNNGQVFVVVMVFGLYLE